MENIIKECFKIYLDLVKKNGLKENDIDNILNRCSDLNVDNIKLLLELIHMKYIASTCLSVNDNSNCMRAYNHLIKLIKDYTDEKKESFSHLSRENIELKEKLSSYQKLIIDNNWFQDSE